MHCSIRSTLLVLLHCSITSIAFAVTIALFVNISANNNMHKEQILTYMCSYIAMQPVS